MPSSAAPSHPSLNLAQHQVFFQDLNHSSPKYMLLSHPKQRRSLLVQDLMLGGWFRVLPHLSVLTLSSFYCPSLWTHTAPCWQFPTCSIFAIKSCAWFSSVDLSHDRISMPLTPLGPQFLDNFSYSQERPFETLTQGLQTCPLMINDSWMLTACQSVCSPKFYLYMLVLIQSCVLMACWETFLFVLNLSKVDVTLGL